jgi:hypothetical protein
VKRWEYINGIRGTSTLRPRQRPKDTLLIVVVVVVVSCEGRGDVWAAAVSASAVSAGGHAALPARAGGGLMIHFIALLLGWTLFEVEKC